MARLLTQAQFARKTKYSRARITQLVKQGVIILKNGKVDPAQAEAAIEANIDRSRRMKAEAKARAAKTPQMEFSGNGFNTDQKKDDSKNGFNTKEKPSLTDARRDHELRKMEKTELEIRARRGQLVQKDEAVKWVTAIGSAAKLAFLGLPRRLAGILKTMTDEKEIELLLLSEIRNIIRRELEAPLAKSKHARRKSSKRGMAGHLEATG